MGAHAGTDLAAPPLLKEWAAVARALAVGRQRVLLRKGGIHERAFVVPDRAHDAGEPGDPVALYPTVAHEHRDRVRDEHHDLLDAAEGDATDRRVRITVVVRLLDVVEVARPDRLDGLLDLHVWTAESVARDRLAFRPRHPLRVLVPDVRVLTRPVELARTPAHGGCASWLDPSEPDEVAALAPLAGWPPPASHPAVDAADQREVAERVRRTVG